ncbi:DUF5675 family protein [Pseudodesulfovibrio tunisiensis]|uniref:DUF5675 family protein n=1 Tax=Pseudodesulfovibrio tunisiensis TaxID=463192 RepID=UPI001FB277D2|nr:DUF5675 family protein [Pseudodesulfovibrio tunisiensis]
MFKRADIIRMEQGEDGTFGVLLLDGQTFCVTLEPPRQRKGGGQCIPEGEYACCRTASPRFGNTFEITDVPGREHILLHPGNTIIDSMGCVLLGSKFGSLGFERGVLESRAAFGEFLNRAQGMDEFTLTVRDRA